MSLKKYAGHDLHVHSDFGIAEIHPARVHQECRAQRVHQLARLQRDLAASADAACAHGEALVAHDFAEQLDTSSHEVVQAGESPFHHARNGLHAKDARERGSGQGPPR